MYCGSWQVRKGPGFTGNNCELPEAICIRTSLLVNLLPNGDWKLREVEILSEQVRLIVNANQLQGRSMN